MSSILTKIMHHIVRFAYPYLLDIEEESRSAADRRLKSRFRSLGERSNLGANPSIANPERISIGKCFYAKHFLRMEAIKEYGGKQLKVERQPPQIMGSYEWVDGAPIPQRTNEKIEASKLIVYMMFKGEERDED